MRCYHDYRDGVRGGRCHGNSYFLLLTLFPLHRELYSFTTS